MNTIDSEANAKTAWVNVFMETQELPANDAKIPDQLDTYGNESEHTE